MKSKKESFDEKSVIKNIKKGKTEGFEALKKKYLPLFFAASKRFRRQQAHSSTYSAENKTKGSVDCFESEFPSILYDAIMSFNEKKKTAFSTWFYNFTRFTFLKRISTAERYVFTDSTEKLEGLSTSQCGAESLHKLDTKQREEHEYIASLVSQITNKKIKKIIELRYFGDNGRNLHFHEIAREMKLTRQCVSLLHTKFLKFLRKKVTSSSLFDRI